jgi:prepilin-type N-terminal cleavage/methylation domain-containing protein
MHRPPHRRAFTLIEIVLVLALLSTVAAMAWPAMRESLAQQRLRSAAEQVRAAWMKARLDAMRTGQIHVFRYDVDTGSYAVEPWETDADETELSSFAADGASARGASGVGQGFAAARSLPERVYFGGVLIDVSSRELYAYGDVPGPLAAGPNPSGAALSVLFYPDGTASDVAELLLYDEEDRRLALSMHGLTGIVTISRAGAVEEGR